MKANLRLPVLERFATVYRSVLRGSGRDRRRSQGACPVRVVDYRLDEPSDTVYCLATTLLDPAAAPAAELAALYHERWEVETAYDEVKTHILGPGAILRSKTPDLVLQEVHGLMLAHYAVRRLIHEAARKVDEDPDRLSFVHAVRVVRRRVENRMNGFASACWTRFSGLEAKPRGVKRKMSYPLRGPGPVSRRDNPNMHLKQQYCARAGRGPGGTSLSGSGCREGTVLMASDLQGEESAPQKNRCDNCRRNYRLDEPSDTVYCLATTLLDPAAAPAAELAALYHERWEVETAYDEVKTHILGPGAILRSKTPDLVLQEVHGLMLAHYAVRRLIHEAARKVDEDPDRLSFVHAVRVVRRRVENPGVSPLISE